LVPAWWDRQHDWQNVAGIFIPSLAVGAIFGRIVGLAMEWIEFQYPTSTIFDVCRDTECIVPGLYAMVGIPFSPTIAIILTIVQVGAAATLAGVTRTTVSLAVIILELTATLNYVVPVMLGVLVAKTVADAIEKKGIYDLVIESVILNLLVVWYWSFAWPVWTSYLSSTRSGSISGEDVARRKWQIRMFLSYARTSRIPSGLSPASYSTSSE